MKSTVRKASALLPVVCGLLLAANHADAQEVYGKVGILGVGAGYAHTINEYFAVRTDFSTVDTLDRNGTAGQLDYDAELKANQLGFYGDYFPFGGSFRLTAGLHSRKLEVVANGRHDGSSIFIGDINVSGIIDDLDTAQASVKWSSIAPYIGMGWGHHATQSRGFGFIADIGVSFGSPKTSLTISDDLRYKAIGAIFLSGSNMDVDEEVEKQRREIADDLEKFSAFPHAFIGLSYRF